MTDQEKQNEEDRETLLALGYGCPRAVSLQGAGAIAGWCSDVFEQIEAGDRAAVGDGDAEEAATDDSEETDPYPGGEPLPFGVPAVVEAIHGRLEALEHAVDAVAVSQGGFSLKDHDEQISGLNAALREAEEKIDWLKERSEHADGHIGKIETAAAGLAERLDAQESQGKDQWAGIEANTAGRIAAGTAAKALAKRVKKVEGTGKKGA